MKTFLPKLLLAVLFGIAGMPNLSIAAVTFTSSGAAIPNLFRAASAWGDYDGDGDLDVVVSGETTTAGTYSAGLYKNTAGAFALDGGSTITAAFNGSFSWGDYDGDGDLDLLQTGQTTTTPTCTTIVYTNTAGVLTNSGQTFAGVYSSASGWADYDLDGDLDFAISGLTGAATTSGTTLIYKNNSGTFAASGISLVGLGKSSMAWGDYDNDGDPDLVVGGFSTASAYRTILYANTAGAFADAGATLQVGSRGSLAWGDYDADGDLDLLMCGTTDDNPSGSVLMVYSNTAGTLSTISHGITAMSYASAAWGDYDNDGDLDVLICGVTTASVRKAVVWTNAAGAFTDAGYTIAGGSWASANWVDFDNDNDLDLFVAGSNNSAATGAQTRLFTSAGATVNTAPGAPTALTSAVTNGKVLLNWTRPTDTQTAQGGLNYNIRIGTSTGGNQITGSQATAAGYRRVSANGMIQWLVGGITENLVPGTYYWSVQAVDGNLKGGAFATEGTFTITNSIVTTGSILPNVWHGSTTWGDYDNDGDLDVAIAGQNSAGTSIAAIYNYNGSTFTDITAGLPGVIEAALAWGDYDRDGDLDLALSGYTGSAYITRIYNYNGSTFTDISAGLTGFNFGSLSWGDYDNDGDLDLLANGLISGNFWEGRAKIFQNNAGTFTDIGAAIDGTGYAASAWGDYDNDGDLDFVINGYVDLLGYETLIYKNTNGSFAKQSAGLTGGSRGGLAFGDYDSDGDLDLAVSGTTDGNASGGFAKIYQNNGSGVYTDIGASILQLGFSSVSWGDFDNDGDLDLLISGTTSSLARTAKVYRNDAGTFNDFGSFVAGGFASVAFGDYDNDGDLDLLTSGSFSGVVGGATTRVWRNDALTVNAAPTAPTGLTSAINFGGTVKLTWNKATDVVTPQNGLNYNIRIGTSTGSNNIYSSMASAAGLKRLASKGLQQWNAAGISIANLPAGTYFWSVQAVDGELKGGAFGTEATFVVANPGGNLPNVFQGATTWGDYDNDGDLDVAISGINSAGANVAAIYNYAAGTYTDIIAGLPAVNNSAMAWGDYDGDGDLDLVMSGYTGAAYITRIYQNTAGVFTDISAGLTGLNLGSLSWGDYDNDGDLDLLANGQIDANFYSGVTKLYQNNGGTFTDAVAGIDGLGYASSAWGDHDNDGDLDFVVGGYDHNFGFTYQTLLYQNTSGVFTKLSAGLQGGSRGGLAFGDYDGDGDLDLAVSGCSSGDYLTSFSKIYRNDAGVYTDIAASIMQLGYSSVSWGDFDNDGDLDLLISGTTSSIARTGKIYRNDAGTFTDYASLSAGGFASVAWGDYDNDGDLDALTTGSYNGVASGANTHIYVNSGFTANAAPTAPTGLLATPTLGRVKLTWNKATDVVTPQDGLNYNLRIGTSSGANDVYSSMASAAGVRRIASKGLAQWNAAGITINNLSAGTYFWSVQAVDGELKGSAFATEGTFNVNTLTSTGALLPNIYLGATAWGDYDNDGDLDVALSGVNTAGTFISGIYSNSGGTFTDIGAGITGLNQPALAWGDYDKDGDLDLAISGVTSGSVYIARIYRNDGGAFVNIAAPLTGVWQGSMAWGDYDNDGDLDLLSTGLTNNNFWTGISRLYTNTNGTFANSGISIDGVGYSSSAWGDYDADGDLDFVISGYTDITGYQTLIYKNFKGQFVKQSAGLTGMNNGSVAWGDYDSDGDLDLAVCGTTNGNTAGSSSKIYRNTAGVFTDIAAPLQNLSYSSLTWADYDNDGDLDLAIAGTTSGINRLSLIYRNTAGVFDEFGSLAGGGIAPIAWGDYDNDGDADLLTTGSSNGLASGALTRIFRNDGVPVNAVPTAPTGLVSSVGYNFVKLTWNKATDAITPQNGLNYNIRVGTTSGANDILSGMASAGGFRRLSSIGGLQWSAAGDSLKGLIPGTYFWSVQAVDGALKGGPFATEGTFTVTTANSIYAKVTFQVQLINSIPLDGNGLHIVGTFNGYDPNASPMTFVSGITYEYAQYFLKGALIEYKYLNGNTFLNQETVLGPCSYNPSTNPNRYLVIPNTDQTITTGFGSCTSVYPYPSPRIAFVGSSSTYGFGTTQPSYMSYPIQFWKLKGSSLAVGNFGRNSTTMLQAPSGGPISYWTSVDYDNAIAYQPDLLYINLGANDVKSTNFKTTVYKADYRSMVAAFKVVNANVEPVLTLPFKTTLASEPLAQDSMRPAVRELSLEKGWSMLDLYNPTLAAPFALNPDQTHTDSLGHSIMAAHTASYYDEVAPVVSQTGDNLNASAGFASYQWYKNGVLIPGATTNTYAVDAAGANYKVLSRLNMTWEDRKVSNELISTCPVQPTLASTTQTGLSCDGQNLTIALTGLLNNKSLNIIYTINGGSPVTISNVAVTGTTVSLSIPANLANNGQLFEIVSMGRTDVAPSCVQPFSTNNSVTLYVYPRPTVLITANDFVCQGQTAPVDFGFTGTGPWVMNYTINTVPQVAVNTPTSPYPSPYTNATVARAYVITSLSDANCTALPGGLDAITIDVPIPCSITWNGSVSGDWNNAANWTPNNSAPSNKTSVVIPSAGVTFQPDLNNNTPSAPVCASITLTGNALPQIQAGFQLNVRGDLAGTGAPYFTGAGKIVLSGTGTQTITGTVRLGNVDFANTSVSGVVIAPTGTLQIEPTGVATFLSGSKLSNNGRFILASNALATASIGPVPSTATFTGNVTQQRHIPSFAQGWYFVGTPIKDRSVADLNDNIYTFGPMPGAQVPNPGPNTSSIFLHREAGLAGGTDPEINGWEVPSVANNANGPFPDGSAIQVGRGYRVYLNGSWRTPILGFDFTGAPTIVTDAAPFNFTLGYTPAAYSGGGWNFVANPFPSAINWDAPTNGTNWTKTNVDNAIYIWNKTSYGSYVAGLSTNGVTNIIPSSQGFIVKANGAAPVLSAREAIKSATSGSFLRVAALSDMVRITLINQVGTKDESIVAFREGATDAFDAQFDAHDLSSSLNIGTSLESVSYGINCLSPLQGTSHTIPVTFEVPQLGEYQLKFTDMGSFNSDYTVYLKDNVLGTLTPVSNDYEHTFEVAALEQGTFRFELVFTTSVTAVVTKTSGSFDVFPNPSSGSVINLLVSGLQDATGLLIVTDVLGKEVAREVLSMPAGSYKGTLKTHLAAGVYNIELRTDKTRAKKMLIVR